MTHRLKDGIPVLLLMTAVIVIMILFSAGTAHAAAKGKISAYGGLRLRSGAGTSYRILTVIPNGTTITLKSKTGNWYRTSYSGKAGYVSASYVKKLSSSSATATTSSTTSKTGYVRASGGLRLRSGAGTSYRILTVIPNGTTITLKSKTGNWYRTSYSGKAGYVSASYVKKLSSSSATATTSSTTSKTGYVRASGGLNLRKGAGTSYGVICVIPNGSAVTVKSSSGSWYKVVYNGKTGYVSSSYISWSKSTSTLVKRSSSLPSASTVISKAVSWAIATANDNSHGYSLLASRRWGNPDYDCSTFVASAYRAAGLSLTYGGLSSVMYCGIMKTIFTADGFEWIPWSKIGGVSNLKAGDVLLDASAHTELYIGSGKTAAAHSDRGYPQAGDQTGTEVSVAGYYNNVGGVSWDGVLRYVG